jgi:hypothetical protein
MDKKGAFPGTSDVVSLIAAVQDQGFLTDWLSAFDRRRRRLFIANQRTTVTLNNRVGIGN